MNKFGISKSTMVFKISIVKFLIKYPKMKKSSKNMYKNIIFITYPRKGKFYDVI